MTKKNKIVLGIVLALLIIVVAGISIYIYFDYQRYNHEEELKIEVNSVLAKDYTSDTFLVDTKTKGSYQVVEKTIKEYMQKYANAVQSVLSVAHDEKFVQILSIDNYKKDAKEFKNTKEYIEKTKQTLNDNYNIINTYANKENILKEIDNKKLSEYYTNLYKEIMSNDQFIKKITQTKDMVDKNYQTMIKLLDSSQKVIDFLVKNNKKWEIKNNLVEFENDSLLKDYNKLINEVKSVTK